MVCMQYLTYYWLVELNHKAATGCLPYPILIGQNMQTYQRFIYLYTYGNS